MAKTKIQPPFTSRMKRTNLYTKGGKTFFGRWNPPQIVLDGDEPTMRVPSTQEGQLDLIAYKKYGDRTLFWAIALANNIRSISDEVVAGLEIVIPKIENIRASLSET